jgi:transposase
MSDGDSSSRRRRGRPLPPDLRERVMRLLAAGHGPSDVARRLLVSRQTVYRYRRAAAEQQAAVPTPKPAGGWRHGKVDRRQIVALARLALEHPKDTLEELRRRAAHLFPADDVPSRSAISRALHKAGVGQRRARFVDKRTESDPLIALERRLFKEAQKNDPVLKRPEKLLFVDESNFRLNEQQARGWGVAGRGARVFRSKGQSPTYNVMATIGAGGFLHHVVHKPERAERELAERYEASELEAPGHGVDVGMPAAEIRRAPAATLKNVLRAYRVKLSDADGQPLSLSALRQTVLQLKRSGRLGLLRASRGGRFQGGPKKPHRASADDVADYLELLAEEPDAADRTVVWDNASSHGAQGTKEAGKVSVFDRLARQLGLGGVVYLPPRSPDLNPIEVLFAYVKRIVRHEAPDDGYAEDELLDAIGRAMDRVTPQMIDNWIRGCGYGPQPERERGPEQNCQTTEADLRRSGHIVCADRRGTVRKVKPAGRKKWKAVSRSQDASDDELEDIAARLPARRPPDLRYDGPRRWTGYGPRPPGLVEQIPESVRLAGRDDPEVYHVERLVDRRVRRGRVEYLVRWCGYDDEDDTWEPRENLMAGAERMARDYERRQR